MNWKEYEDALKRSHLQSWEEYTTGNGAHFLIKIKDFYSALFKMKKKVAESKSTLHWTNIIYQINKSHIGEHIFKENPIIQLYGMLPARFDCNKYFLIDEFRFDPHKANLGYYELI